MAKLSVGDELQYSMEIVLLLEIQSCYDPKNLMDMKKWKVQKHQENQQYCLIKRKDLAFLLMVEQTEFVQRAEQDLTIPSGLICDMLRNKLHILPYKIQVLQPIEDSSYRAPTNLISRCLQNIQAVESFLSQFIYSHKCVLH